MISIKGVTKNFDDIVALDNLDLTVQTGSIYGLIGVNGAGKTTIIKHMAGVLKPDQGAICYDGQPVWENEEVKQRIGLIPDDLYFPNGYTIDNMARLYQGAYSQWNEIRFHALTELFKLEENRKLRTFSKGMKKQAAFSLVMSTMPDFLLLDEPIDGLDPIVRKLVWKYIVDDVAERQMSVLVSSHNLKEMEGICDYIGIISKGKMMLERDLDALKGNVHKVQVAFANGEAAVADPYAGLNILHKESRGNVDLLIIRDRAEKVEAAISAGKPVVFDMLPLSLEEIFIYEMGGEDDEISKLIF
jgi:ABC-type multidrug transport system, ATPase component